MLQLPLPEEGAEEHQEFSLSSGFGMETERVLCPVADFSHFFVLIPLFLTGMVFHNEQVLLCVSCVGQRGLRL